MRNVFTGLNRKTNVSGQPAQVKVTNECLSVALLNKQVAETDHTTTTYNTIDYTHDSANAGSFFLWPDPSAEQTGMYEFDITEPECAGDNRPEEKSLWDY